MVSPQAQRRQRMFWGSLTGAYALAAAAIVIVIKVL